MHMTIGDSKTDQQIASTACCSLIKHKPILILIDTTCVFVSSFMLLNDCLLCKSICSTDVVSSVSLAHGGVFFFGERLQLKR